MQLARAPLRARQDLLDGPEHGRTSTFAEQRAQALRADVVGIALRPEIAADLLGDSDVAEDHPQQILVELALPDQLHRQDANAFLKGLGDALHRLRAGGRTADVDMMRRVDDVAQEHVAVEHGHHHVEVRIVPAAQERVVGDDGVARRDAVQRHVVEDVLHHVGHRSQMSRRVVALGDEPGLRIEDAGGEILAFAHRLGECGAAKRAAHLVRDRDQRVPYDRQRDRVDLTVRLIAHGAPPD